MNNTTIGILAHVDAGKTTFSEQILCHAGVLRRPGRVDHGDAFLDAHPLEKQRGITIFADQAVFVRGGRRFFWVDTPGHADFAAEAARAATALDYAVLVISGAEGVQGHAETLWGMLEGLKIPVILFINKVDRQGFDPQKCLAEVRRRLSGDCVDMGGYGGGEMPDDLIEAVAERDEELLDRLLGGDYDPEDWTAALRRQIRGRLLFPVYYGSALNDVGVAEFLQALGELTEGTPPDDGPFDALVYKVRHDERGGQLTFFRVFSGSVRPREAVALPGGERQKLNELRLYSGAKYQVVPSAEAGMLICVPGLNGLRPGDRMGAGWNRRDPFALQSMLSASVSWDPSVHITQVLRALRQLEAEDPALNVRTGEAAGSIDVDVMGPIQLEVLTRLMEDRFGIAVTFGRPRVMYMETLAAPAVGIGHYEPLRHYAEVQLRLSPGPRGSGITFESKCHVDELALNWQRLIETHVFERPHRGVLTGARLTDVRVELLHGRAHLKHTEGGDFRQATCRAIRNALMYAESVLLEPVCRFSLTLPGEDYGRVMGDLNQMQAQVDPPEMMDGRLSLRGEVPFARFAEYPTAFMAATHGRGSLSVRLHHYAPCRDARAIIEAAGYNPLADDTPDSVFCTHGAGHVVPWDQVRAHAHTRVGLG